MTAPPVATPTDPGKPPRTVRTRNAALGAIASFVIGVGIGASGSSAAPAPGTAAPDSTPNAVASSVTAPAAASTDSPTAEPTVEPTPEPTPAPAEPVTVKGSGSQKTKPFDMPGGDFAVVITGNGDGNVIASLIPRGADPFEGETLFNEISDGKYKYETQAYGVEAGSYYLDMSNDNAWVVTFTPLQ